MKINSALFLYVSLLSFICISSAVATEADTQALNLCEFVAETAAKANAKISSDMVDRDKGAPFVKEYLVQNVVWREGSNASPALADRSAVYNSDEQDYYETHLRWVHDVGFLPYLGNWYKVYAQTDSGAARGARATGAYISAILDQTGLVCAFNNLALEHAAPTLESYRLPVEERLDCSAVIDSETVILPDVPLKEGIWIKLRNQLAEDHYPEWFAKNSNPWSPFLDGKTMPRTIGPVMRVDINNDGIRETLLSINYSTASNYACDVKYFDLVDDKVTGVVKSDLREALLKAQDISRNEVGEIKYTCGRTNEIISLNDRIAISSRQRLTRHVSMIKGVTSDRVCKSTFTVEPVVIFDSSN